MVFRQRKSQRLNMEISKAEITSAAAASAAHSSSTPELRGAEILVNQRQMVLRLSSVDVLEQTPCLGRSAGTQRTACLFIAGLINLFRTCQASPDLGQLVV